MIDLVGYYPPIATCMFLMALVDGMTEVLLGFKFLILRSSP
jgi:hypothetical protein